MNIMTSVSFSVPDRNIFRYYQGKKGKGDVFHVLNHIPRHEDVWGNGDVAPCIHYLGNAEGL
jgi:hypothetical protein